MSYFKKVRLIFTFCSIKIIKVYILKGFLRVFCMPERPISQHIITFSQVLKYSFLK